MLTTNRDAARLIPHRDYYRAQTIAAAGRKDFGKTTFVREYLTTGPEPRVLALDPFNDFDFMPRAELETALEALEDDDDPLRVRVVPRLGQTLTVATALFRAIVQQERLRRCLLVLDEMTLWSEPRATRDLMTIVLQGRRLGLRLLVASQRLNLLPTVIRGDITHLVLFRTNAPDDVEAVREWAGEEVAESAQKLDRGQCELLVL